nr:putative integron gene cassette protein [uncultured bacterium]
MAQTLGAYMLIRFWFQTSTGLGYGVTAESEEAALALLQDFGYPLSAQQILRIVKDVLPKDLDQLHVVPNLGLLPVRGVWFPNHNS